MNAPFLLRFPQLRQSLSRKTWYVILVFITYLYSQDILASVLAECQWGNGLSVTESTIYSLLLFLLRRENANIFHWRRNRLTWVLGILRTSISLMLSLWNREMKLKQQVQLLPCWKCSKVKYLGNENYGIQKKVFVFQLFISCYKQ